MTHFDSDENNALFAFYWLADPLALIQVTAQLRYRWYYKRLSE